MLDFERKIEGKFRDYGVELKKEISGFVQTIDVGETEALTLSKRIAKIEEY